MEPHATEASEDTRTAWHWKDPLHYRSPFDTSKPSAEQAWETMLSSTVTFADARYNAYKSEIQNLLIFAGVFSAIVTAFVVDLSKEFVVDPSQIVVGLLAHMMDGPPPYNVTGAELVDQLRHAEGPSKLVQVINALWLYSLYLSLLAVVASISGLQWIKGLQTFPDGVPAQIKLSIHQLRRLSFDNWRVFDIFAAISITLQLALILFLTGMILFLQLRTPKPWFIIPGACLPMLFLAIFTSVPVIQWLFRTWTTPKDDCGMLSSSDSPFKSPLSSILIEILTNFHQKCRFRSGATTQSRMSHDQHALQYTELHLIKEHHSKLSEDMKIKPEVLKKLGGNSLCALWNNSDYLVETRQPVVYQCFQDLFATQLAPEVPREEWKNYLNRILPKGNPDLGLNFLVATGEPVPEEVVQLESYWAAFGAMSALSRPPKVTAAHLHEIYIRLHSYHFSRPLLVDNYMGDTTSSSLYKLLSEQFEIKSRTERIHISEQYTLLLEIFLGRAAAHSSTAYHGNPFKHFLEIAYQNQNVHGKTRTITLFKKLIKTYMFNGDRYLLFYVIAFYMNLTVIDSSSFGGGQSGDPSIPPEDLVEAVSAYMLGWRPQLSALPRGLIDFGPHDTVGAFNNDYAQFGVP